MTGSESSAHTSAERRRLLVAFAVLALVTGYVFRPLISSAMHGRPRFFEWDVAEQYWPDLVYLCDSLHHGELPTWNPYDRGGYPYYADPQSGAYHPLNWAICAVAGSSPGLWWATARVVFGFALAGVFALLWLRRLRFSTEASLLGAVLFECAPFMRHNLELNLTLAFAWLPLMLFAVEGALQRRRLRDAASLALAIALCAWTGSPPALWLACTFLALYLGMRVWSVARILTRHERVSLAACLGATALLAAALVTVVMVPGLTLAKHSVQAGRSFSSISEGSLQLKDLWALVWPQDGNHLYAGLLPLLLLPVGISFARRAKSESGPLLVFATLVYVLAVLLTLGEHAFVFRLAFDWVPGVAKFRLPTRYEAWIGPAAAVIVAVGFDALRARAGWIRERGPLVAAAVALLSCFDVTRTLAADLHTRETPAPYATSSASRVTGRVRGLLGTTADRVMDEFGVSCRSGTRLHWRDFRGYQDPLMLRSYEHIVDSLHEHPNLVPQYNVRYALTSPHFIHGWEHHYLPPPTELDHAPRVQSLGDGIFEFVNALPFAYFVSNANVTRASESQALALIEQQAPARILVIEDANAARQLTAREELAHADGTRVLLHKDDLEFEIDAPSAGFVVVNEAYYPGWRAFVDGRETSILRANAFVRAIAVREGRHQVQMRFMPVDAKWTRALWLFALALSMSLLVIAKRRSG